MCGYRSVIRAHLLSALGLPRIEHVAADRIEYRKATVPVGNRSKAKVLTVLTGVLKRARRVHLDDSALPRLYGAALQRAALHFASTTSATPLARA